MSGSRTPIVVVLSLAAAAAAQSTPPQVDAELRARFGFLGPKLHKVGDGINLLRCVDLDGDGDDEIVVNHGERGRLTILRRNADDSIETEHVDTDGTIYGLDFADVDGDGALDYVMHNQRGRLVVISGVDANAPAPAPEIEIGAAGSTDALRIGDVDGDGRPDAVVLLGEGVRVIANLGPDARPLPVMTLDFERPRSFLLDDVDGDGNLDVTLLTSRNAMPLHVKLGDGKGGFGPWTMFRTPVATRAFLGPGADGRPTLTLVQDQRGRIVDYRLSHGPVERAVAPQFTSIASLDRGAFPFACGDVDADGDTDLVLAHPERAELVFLFEENGTFRTESVPSLSGVSSLALGDYDGDGRIDVLLASGEEEAVAWKSGALPVDAFPTRLPGPPEPIAAAFAPNGDVLIVTKDKRREGKLFRLTSGSGEPTELGDLGKLAANPGRMLTASVDDAEGAELVFVVPGDGVRVVNLTDGSSELAGDDSSAGFTKDVEDGALSIVREGARDAVMVVRERFARTFRVDEHGQVSVVRQVNAPTDGGKMSLGTVFGDGRRVFVDRNANKLYVVRDGSAPTSFDVPEIGVTHLLEHAGAALLIGRSGVVRIPFDETWQLDAVRSHEPPTEDTNYWAGACADLDHDGNVDLALLDEDINGVQILVAEPRAFRRALGFPVFEIPEKRERVYEPREIAIGDWNQDGLDDFVLVSHDRVLIYPQEK